MVDARGLAADILGPVVGAPRSLHGRRGPDMLTLIAILACCAPGAILAFAVPPGRDRWIALAAAPILTLGLVGLGLAWLPRLGISDSALSIFRFEFAIAVAGVAVSYLVGWLRSGSTGRSTPVKTTSAAAMPAVPAERSGRGADVKVLEPAAAGAGDALDTDAASDQPGQTGTLDTSDGGAADATAQAESTQAEAVEAEPESVAESPRPRMKWWKWFGWGDARPRAIEVISIGVPSVLAVLFGRLILAPIKYPPGWDAMNHGLLTANILKSGSTAVDSVCTTGGILPELSCHFYPLGFDTQWAQLSLLTGHHLSQVMLTWSAAVGPLALVLAVYAAVRAFGGHPVVAGAAGLLPVLLSPMFPALLTGRPPESFAPGMSVAVAVLAALALRGRQPVRFGILTGIGVAGLIMSHTYEILFALTLTIAFMFVWPMAVKLRSALVAAAATVLVTVVAVAPVAGSLLGASSERIKNPPEFPGHLAQAFEYWVTSLQGYTLWGPPPYAPDQPLTDTPIHVGLIITIVCLFASPLCLVFKQLRWARPWLFVWGFWTLIGLWTSTSNSHLAIVVDNLWYGVVARLRTMVLPVHGVLVVAGACAIGLALHRLVTLLIRRTADGRIAVLSGATMAAIVVAGLAALAAQPSARAPLVADLKSRSAQGTQYAAVFQWLADHTSPGMTVAYDRHVQFMTWSYIDYGTPATFGIPPLVAANEPNFAGRWLAWKWLVNRDNAAPAGCLVRKYAIQYVVVGEQRMPGYKLDYSPTHLSKSLNVTLVHQDRGILVYEVNARGSACPVG
jgi:hypothetical protein